MKRDRLRAELIGEEAINGCEEDMVDWSSSKLQLALDAYGEDLKYLEHGVTWVLARRTSS